MTRTLDGASGIRGLACLMVLIGHAAGFSFFELTPFVGWFGKVGVWLFFVLSAFLLTIKLDSTGFSSSAITDYVVGRFIRIIPLFCIAIAIYYAAGEIGILNLNDAFMAATFQQGYGHLWTIPVEFKFYFFLPVIAFVMQRTMRFAGLYGVSLLSILLVVVVELAFPYWKTPENSIELRWYLPCFVFGVVAARAYISFDRTVPEWVPYLVMVFVVLFLIAMTPYMRLLVFGNSYGLEIKDKFVYISLVWSFFVFVFVGGRYHASIFLKSLFLRKLGEYSFSIYLIHWLVMSKVKFLFGESMTGFVLDIAFSVIAGMLLYYLFERPIQRLRYARIGRKLAIN